MKIRILLAMLAFIGVVTSCQKEQPLTPNDSSIVSPSFFGEEEDGEPVNPPPPSSDDEGNPFEIG